MADIQEIPLEIPLDNTENTLDNENIQPEIQEENIEIQPEIQKESGPVEEEIIPVKPKAKGRPKGAKNLGPPKPRPKRKTVVEDTIEEEYKENTYVPSSPRQNRQKKISEAPPDVAAVMLKMLQEQQYSRQARKQALYRSWFR